jgi:protocatechuate 3,4-dioxygenase beta subunit
MFELLHESIIFPFVAAALIAQLGQAPPPAAPPGTAILRGHVFAGDTGQPLRKAQVRISAFEIRENRMTTTDENGAYEFKELRAGRYTITASKGSYVNLSYGQQRPTDAPKPLELLDRQTMERVDLALARGGVVTGRVVDEFGEPASEIQVAMQRYQFMQGMRRLVPAGRMVTTNDIGEFRLFGIPPGQYYLSATWRNASMGNTVGSASDRTAYAPLFFPGTLNVNEARRITMAAGQELDDLVMVLKPVKASRISGTVTGLDGKPLTPAMLMVMQSNTGFGFAGAGGAQVKPDGTFTVSGLAPGTYNLRAQRMGGPGEGPEIAAADVTVNGDDIADLRLVAARPSKLTGRIVVDPSAAASLPATLTIGVSPVNMLSVPAPPPPPARVAEDLTFELKPTPGAIRLVLGGGFTGPPTGWAIRSVRLEGVDVTDSGITVRPNEDVAGVELELTNRLTTVTGTVTNSRGEASKDYIAIVFAQDKEKWIGSPRYQSTGRPDQDGRFKIAALPAGEYYIVAVDAIEPGQSADPDFLERIRSSATAFSLREGETKSLDLKLHASM